MIPTIVVREDAPHLEGVIFRHLHDRRPGPTTDKDHRHSVRFAMLHDRVDRAKVGTIGLSVNDQHGYAHRHTNEVRTPGSAACGVLLRLVGSNGFAVASATKADARQVDTVRRESSCTVCYVSVSDTERPLRM